MCDQQADLTQLRREIDAFIHIMEVLAMCREQLATPLNPDAVQRLAHVLNRHIASAVSKIYND